MCCLFLRFPQHIGVGNPGRGEEKASLGTGTEYISECKRSLCICE